MNAHGEISYDLVMTADMAFVEAAFRLPGEAWQVLIVSRRDVLQSEITRTEWESGVKGLVIHFPSDQTLDARTVEDILSEATETRHWRVVRGPDSMSLR